MAIKILIRRRVPEGKNEELIPLLVRLRNLATKQIGYISGETLRNKDDRGDYLVISTWQSLQDWQDWERLPDREAIQSTIDATLGTKTTYEIFVYD
jgi:heme-degrading monooxygenase HmoA